MVNMFIGLLPGIIWILLFVVLDSNKKKRNYKYLLLLFILGGLGSYFCYRLEMHFGSYFKKTSISNYGEILIYAICGVAIFEEGYKWLLLLINYLKKKSNTKFDIIYNSIFISIGFATFENILFYVNSYGFSSFSRIVTAFFSHVANALWMGYFLDRFNSSKKNKILNLILSIVIPIMLHALYNSFLYGNRKYGMFFSYYYILLLISTLLLYVIVIRKE